MDSRLLGAAVTLVAAIAFSGCARGVDSVEIIDMQTDSFSFPADSAGTAVIELDLGIGELRIEGGSDALCAGELRYNVADWKPVVEHRLNGGEATVRVTQPSIRAQSVGNKARTYWTLSVSEDVPVRLVIDIGVGESSIDLTNALVERIDVDTGVGEVSIDASDVTNDLVIDIESGVGAVSIRVPEDIGVHVACDRGIGSFHHIGLVKTHGGYVNAAYGESDALITIRVDSGVGEVRVATGTETACL